jgi:hypothetical protein
MRCVQVTARHRESGLIQNNGVACEKDEFIQDGAGRGIAYRIPCRYGYGADYRK